MNLCRVDGSVISTVCHKSLHGWRVLICQPLDGSGNDDGEPILAIDPHGAGRHQHVIVSSDGMATRECVKDSKSPLRYMVIGIADD